MFTIAKRFTFAASHQLNSLPDGHKCKRLHGHNYTVELWLSAKELDHEGFVRDFGELRWFRNYIDDHLDHQHLNDVLGFEPTAERVAQHLYDIACEQWGEVVAVRVWETETSWAEYGE